jgi:hypothetical protein
MPTGPSDPAIDAQESALAHLKAIPWEALYGQYGCTVKGVEVKVQVGGDGVSRATAGLASDCPPGIDGKLIMFLVLPRADAHVAA